MHVASMPIERTGGQALRVDFDPVTRVAGSLAFRTVVDADNSAVVESAAMATRFRGYEVILKGRDARDAIFISSRACGVCGGAHATCSALAMEMALGIAPPPMGIVARNMLAAVEDLVEYPTHLFGLAGPDYSEPVIRATNPELWARAQHAPAAGVQTHGFELISDIMTELTRSVGTLYSESLRMARVAREAYVLVGGKYPHPQTIVPGGISSLVDPTDMNLILLRVVRFLDYSRKVVAIWDDLIDFCYETDAGFRDVGAGPMNFIDLGRWDDPNAYDGTWANAPTWGERRWATPGAIVDGKLRTTDLQELDAGVEEFVGHSFYDQWSVDGSVADLSGRNLSRHHPRNKQTIPQPGTSDPQNRYSWCTAPRWNGEPMETGPGARLAITAMAGKLPHRSFIEPTGSGVRLGMPKAELPASELQWSLPASWNALERNRARAYALAYSTLVAYENLVIGYDLQRRGGPPARVFTHYEIPKDRSVGVGFWGASRGYLSHHLEIDARVITNYQIVAPSTFTCSPKDGAGKHGPIEQAVLTTPLLHPDHPERYIDVLRTIRSFDPCLSCASH